MRSYYSILKSQSVKKGICGIKKDKTAGVARGIILVAKSIVKRIDTLDRIIVYLL